MYEFTVDGVVRRALALMSVVSVPADKRAGESR